MARVTTSSFTYLTKHRPNQKAPVRSVIYDGSDRPTSIVYNIAQQGGSETISIDWTTGHPTIDDVEFVGHVVNVWEAQLELVQPVSVVNVSLASGFSTQRISVETVVQVTNTSDRISIAVRNWSYPIEGLTLYLAEDNTKLFDGWPMIAREGIALDIEPGASVYLVSDGDPIDVRLLEIIK